MKRFAIIITALVSSAVLAYVIPAYSILRRLVEKRDNLRLSGLLVTGTVSFFPGEGTKDAASALNIPDDIEVQADARISLKLPGRCRMDVTTAEGGTSASITSGGKHRVEGREIALVSEALGQLCPLLAFRSASENEARDGLDRHLRSLGVEVKPTSLARFDNHVVYVIGKTDPTQAQFWVYKDTFMPARLRYTKDGVKWDVRMRDFGSAVAGDWFPRVVEVHRNDAPVMKFTAFGADASAKLPDASF